MRSSDAAILFSQIKSIWIFVTYLLFWRCHWARRRLVLIEAAQGIELRWRVQWSLGKAVIPEPIHPASLCFVAINRQRFIASPTRVAHMVGATADRDSVPGVDQIEYQR